MVSKKTNHQCVQPPKNTMPSLNINNLNKKSTKNLKPKTLTHNNNHTINLNHPNQLISNQHLPWGHDTFLSRFVFF